MVAKLEEIGVDWLTATSQSDQSAALMQDIWQMVLENEDIGPKWLRDASWQGYVGYRAPHLFMGTRPDGTCIQLSSVMAARYTVDFLDVGARPSRLDLQCTGKTDEGPGKAIEQMFNASKRFTPASGRPPELKMFVGRGGPEGLYVGRRSSEVMVRIYDKGKESREKQYDGCLRVEIELKAGTARRYAGALVTAVDKQEFIASVVRGVSEARGMALPFPVYTDGMVLRKTTYITPVEGKMAWLLSQVSPTIRALIEDVGWERVATAVFPDGLDTHTGYVTMSEMPPVVGG